MNISKDNSNKIFPCLSGPSKLGPVNICPIEWLRRSCFHLKLSFDKKKKIYHTTNYFRLSVSVLRSTTVTPMYTIRLEARHL